MRAPPRPKPRLFLIPLLAAGLAQAACTAERGHDPFTASGELIAMSGGDVGARGACFTCHGLRGEGDGGAAPRLAALDAGYLQRQLRDYAIGLRPDPTMTPVAKALDDEDRRAVAAYYAALSSPLAPAPPGSDPLGRRLYHQGDPARGLAPCAECHGQAGQGVGPANPPLAGQPAAYLAEQLERWRGGIRRNDPLGRMLEISRRLSPAEIEAVAAYAAGLRPPSAPATAPPAPSR